MESTTDYNSVTSMEYPPKSILRFFPSPDQPLHYSAVVLSNQSLLQVKTPTANTKQHFDSVEEWLQSIPEKPTLNQLVIDENPIRKSSEKIMKEPVDEKDNEEKDWKNRKQIDLSKRKTIYPLSYQSFRAFPWLRSIYSFVKEAKPSLLKQEVFIKAFNYLIEFMIRHSDHIVTYIPTFKKYRYDSPLTFSLSDPSPLKKFPLNIHTSFIVTSGAKYYHSFIGTNGGYHTNFQLTEDGTKLINELYDIYQPVYELIKDDVIPYVEKKRKQNVLGYKIQHTRTVLNRVNKQFEHKRIIYEKGVERLRRGYEMSVSFLQTQIKELTSKLEQYKRELE